MGLKGYRLWVMGQLDSTCRAPPMRVSNTPCSFMSFVPFSLQQRYKLNLKKQSA
jgi:hypothetical protein